MICKLRSWEWARELQIRDTVVSQNSASSHKRAKWSDRPDTVWRHCVCVDISISVWIWVCFMQKQLSLFALVIFCCDCVCLYLVSVYLLCYIGSEWVCVCVCVIMVEIASFWPQQRAMEVYFLLVTFPSLFLLSYVPHSPEISSCTVKYISPQFYIVSAVFLFWTLMDPWRCFTKR